jgi:hypothetical protein
VTKTEFISRKRKISKKGITDFDEMPLREGDATAEKARNTHKKLVVKELDTNLVDSENYFVAIGRF